MELSGDSMKLKLFPRTICTPTFERSTGTPASGVRDFALMLAGFILGAALFFCIDHFLGRP